MCCTGATVDQQMLPPSKGQPPSSFVPARGGAPQQNFSRHAAGSELLLRGRPC